MSPLKKTCAVCGDKALGYNFNAVTCESCKAFFRRNALAKKQFTCPFNQNCEISVITRRFCQKCRLKKCIDIGMKSENIMSEEDKIIKRRKIETNRAKRKQHEQKPKKSCLDDDGVGQGQINLADSSYDASIGEFDSRSCGSSYDSGGVDGPATSTNGNAQLSNHSMQMDDYMRDVNPDLMTGEEMVEFIVCDPDRACQAISKLMRTPAEALTTLEKIINSQKDALRLISHLINNPGDALKIISKVMNSPFNALTVFTKFMSSPTDALEIISKIVSSPQDVLEFIKNLMDSPENAMDIMNKFMNTPAEALRLLNNIFNGESSNAPTTPPSPPPATLTSAKSDSDFDLQSQTSRTLSNEVLNNNLETSSPPSSSAFPNQNSNVLMHSMLNYPSPSDLHTSILSPDISSPTPLSTEHGNYLTPPPSAAESLNLASPLEYNSSPVGLAHTNTTTLESAANDELRTATSTDLHILTAPSSAVSADFTDENFDIKSFIQNSFPENISGTSSHARGDSINSLESVLTEVIRIEFQAFNNLPQESRVKQEEFNTFSSTHHRQHNGGVEAESYGNSICIPGQQPLQCAPSTNLLTMSRDLNETELMKLRELKIASEALFLPVDDDLSVLMGDDRIKADDTNQDPKLLQVINLTAVAIKRLIKMAKKISAFRDMCQQDQLALLKGGCTEMMIMRSVMTYDDNRNTWKIPHTKEDMSNIRADVLKLAKGNVYEEHKKFISTFDEKWRMDENIILIMCAIVLFSPNRQRIVHSDVIRLEQNSYYYLLRRYLESIYMGCEAKSAFIKLIHKISDVERLNQVIIGVYLNVNPSQVEPLLREIFDLKNCC